MHDLNGRAWAEKTESLQEISFSPTCRIFMSLENGVLFDQRGSLTRKNSPFVCSRRISGHNLIIKDSRRSDGGARAFKLAALLNFFQVRTHGARAVSRLETRFQFRTEGCSLVGISTSLQPSKQELENALIELRKKIFTFSSLS